MATLGHDANLAAEIDIGFVLHLDPGRLLGLGAKVTSAATTWVEGSHFFVCIAADGKKCQMLPLFSNDVTKP